MPLELPSRPLTAYPPGHSLWSPIMVIGFWLIALYFVTYGMLQPIPDLMADWSIRQTAQPISGGHIENGKCSTRLFLVGCHGTLILRRAGEPDIRREVSHHFVDFHMGDYKARIMADPANPNHLTTDLFLDKLFNRIITLPLYPGMRDSDIGDVINAVKRYRP